MNFEYQKYFINIGINLSSYESIFYRKREITGGTELEEMLQKHNYVQYN